jgi:hypothetical protein
MRRNFGFPAVLTALAFLPLLSAQAPVTGPVQGIVFDGPSGTLRQIQGSFGSASLGPALLSGLEFASMSLSNGTLQQAAGVACSALQCSFVQAGMQQSPITDQIGIPEAAAWSADGTVVAIYSRSGQWIRTFTNGEGGPQLSISSLAGDLVTVAVSPDGKHTVFALAGEHPGVFEVTAAGAFVPLVGSQHPVALAYSSNGDTLYVLDGQQISEVHSNGLVSNWPVDAVQNPAAIYAVSSIVYVAGGGDHALFIYDSTKHTLIEQIPLSFAPSQIQPIGAGSFLLTSRASKDDLLWSFTAGRGAFFVPVTPVETAVPQRKVRR